MSPVQLALHVSTVQSSHLLWHIAISLNNGKIDKHRWKFHYSVLLIFLAQTIWHILSLRKSFTTYKPAQNRLHPLLFLACNLSSEKDQGVKLIFSNLVFVRVQIKAAAGEWSLWYRSEAALWKSELNAVSLHADSSRLCGSGWKAEHL